MSRLRNFDIYYANNRYLGLEIIKNYVKSFQILSITINR